MKLTSSILLLSTISATAAFVVPKQPSTTTSSSSTSLSASRRAFLDAAAVTTTALILPQAALAAGSRPMYLAEPTDEFKANEEKAMAFKRQQLAIKKEFQTILDRLVTEPNDEEKLVNDLTELKALVASTGGLPLGIKKDEMYKRIRTKKAAGFWPTNVEIAYQKLIQEVAFQQSPNLDKEMGSPF